mmetsp:Transcript_2547/g.4448  ORF Transcript_2547/g.4448 Transcript_2547/m.4448 type:complete len:220 (-) Transcript_2547:2117-2776(-)
MVYFFKPENDQFLIYMGKDKNENELLLKYAWDGDVWFHVDRYSSAHVYLRRKEDRDSDIGTVDWIPEDVLEECCQLVKANSIEGCKVNNILVVYTSVLNLKKSADMEVGQVGFKHQNDVKKYRVEKKVNFTVNRINKTRYERSEGVEGFLQQGRQNYQRRRVQREREVHRRKLQEERDRIEMEKKEKEGRGYDHFGDGVAKTSNKSISRKGDDEDDDFW